VKGEAQTLVEAAGAGICVEPENASALADAILTIYRMPDHGAALGEAGQRYVFRHYNRSDIARRFAEELASLRTSDGNRLDPINANASHHP
jgi:glycosyltransferase involved in cell wall biosynthesis